MLNKVVSVKNVGTFRDSRASGSLGNTELGKLSLVHAENARGKTTLCAILRSLKCGDASLILERQTLDSEDSPYVRMLVDGAMTEFSDGAWNTTYEHLEIFDADFIASNVYSSDSITHDHKANLCRVVLGAAGAKLVQDFDAADDQERTTGEALTTARKAIEKLLPKGMTIEQFTAIEKDAEIEAKIADVKSELVALADAEAVAAKPLLTRMVLPNVPSGLADTLRRTVEGIAADAEERVKLHIQQHGMAARGQVWLSEGLKYANDYCPFCEQSLAASSIFEAIGNFFSHAYISFQDELKLLPNTVNKLLGDAALLPLHHTVVNNAILAEFWKKYVAAKAPTLAFGTAVQPVLQELRSALLTMVATKQASPLDAIEFTPEATAAVARLAELVGEVQTYNAAVDQFNAAVGAVKDNAKGKSTATAQKELAALELQKVRHTNETVVLLLSHVDAQRLKTEAEIAKAAARTALDEYNTKVIAKYHGIVNELLETFGAGFRLEAVKVEYKGRTPRAGYVFGIRGRAVDPGNEKTPSGQPCFRNTLSSGDRNTLALAFFIAQLRNRPDLANLVIVFDDPFTSLDAFRQTWTCFAIRKLARDAKQVIVMSHSLDFLKLVREGSDKTWLKTLKIDRHKQEDCHIVELDLDDATAPVTDQDLVQVRSYHHGDSKDMTKTIRAIRPLLENHIRRVAPDDCPPDHGWLGTFIGRINDAEGGTSLGDLKPDYDALDELNAYTSPYAHDSGMVPQINETELLTAVARTLKVIRR
jgi:wobble nucleotide-excising tRNase